MEDRYAHQVSGSESSRRRQVTIRRSNRKEGGAQRLLLVDVLSLSAAAPLALHQWAPMTHDHGWSYYRRARGGMRSSSGLSCFNGLFPILPFLLRGRPSGSPKDAFFLKIIISTDSTPKINSSMPRVQVHKQAYQDQISLRTCRIEC